MLAKRLCHSDVGATAGLAEGTELSPHLCHGWQSASPGARQLPGTAQQTVQTLCEKTRAIIGV